MWKLYRLLIVTSGLVAGLSGCSKLTSPERAATATKTDLGRLTNAPLETEGVEDDAALELVLDDLSIYDGPNLPLNLSPRMPRDIYFSRTAIKWPPQVLDLVDDSELWSELNNSDRTLLREAATHAKNRYETGFVYQHFQPTNKSIHVIETESGVKSSETETPIAASFPIQAWPVGYCRNRTCAVVSLHCPELFHPTTAVYVLALTDGKWTIKYRKIVTHV